MNAVTRTRHLARRTRQTVSVFDNGWTVARQMASGADELEYVIGDVHIHCPNAPGARVPVYEVFAEDEYSVEWFLAGLGPEFTLVDIGAHIGCFSIDVSRKFPGVRIHSYEPTPSTNGFTVRNVEANHLGDRITVHKAAVDATSGTLVMADNGPGSGHNGVLHLGEEGSTTIEVPSESLADVFAQAGIVDAVKLDAEGAEYGILFGSDPSLWSSVRRLVMEYHPSTEHDFDELKSFLDGVGLNLVRRQVGGEGIGLAWFSRDPIS